MSLFFNNIYLGSHEAKKTNNLDVRKFIRKLLHSLVIASYLLIQDPLIYNGRQKIEAAATKQGLECISNEDRSTDAVVNQLQEKFAQKHSVEVVFLKDTCAIDGTKILLPLNDKQLQINIIDTLERSLQRFPKSLVNNFGKGILVYGENAADPKNVGYSYGIASDKYTLLLRVDIGADILDSSAHEIMHAVNRLDEPSHKRLISVFQSLYKDNPNAYTDSPSNLPIDKELEKSFAREYARTGPDEDIAVTAEDLFLRATAFYIKLYTQDPNEFKKVVEPRLIYYKKILILQLYLQDITNGVMGKNYWNDLGVSEIPLSERYAVSLKKETGNIRFDVLESIVEAKDWEAASSIYLKNLK